MRENVDESKGDPIQLYVDRDDPTNITTSTTPIAGILLIFMGATFLLMSLPTLIRTIRKTGMSKRLLEQGIVISVPVYGIERDPSLAVNGKQPYRVRCGYVDASTGKRYTFISNSVWDPIGDLLNPGDLVKVYVQANDYTKYHVDLEGLGNAPTVMDFT